MKFLPYWDKIDNFEWIIYLLQTINIIFWIIKNNNPFYSITIIDIIYGIYCIHNGAILRFTKSMVCILFILMISFCYYIDNNKCSNDNIIKIENIYFLTIDTILSVFHLIYLKKIKKVKNVLIKNYSYDSLYSDDIYTEI